MNRKAADIDGTDRQTDGRTDGRTPHRYKDLALHTTRTALTTTDLQCILGPIKSQFCYLYLLLYISAIIRSLRTLLRWRRGVVVSGVRR